MAEVPFIAIEGPIGVGKTSLAKKLSNQLDFQLLQEIVEENPFLGKFYDDIAAWSFQTEMFFLCNRFQQLEGIERDYLNEQKAVVADYHILKNMIFANRTLEADKFEKYEKIYHILTEDMPVPNIMIYLSASLETLLKRIEKRNRQVEKNIKSSYLSQLISDYEVYMHEFEKTHPDIPVIRIDGDNIDFEKFQEDLKQVTDTVEAHLKDFAGK